MSLPCPQVLCFAVSSKIRISQQNAWVNADILNLLVISVDLLTEVANPVLSHGPSHEALQNNQNVHLENS